MKKYKKVSWQPGHEPTVPSVPPPQPYPFGPEPRIAPEVEEEWRQLPPGTMLEALHHLIPIDPSRFESKPIHTYLLPAGGKRIPATCVLPRGGMTTYMGMVLSWELGRINGTGKRQSIKRYRHRILIGGQAYIVPDINCLKPQVEE